MERASEVVRAQPVDIEIASVEYPPEAAFQLLGLRGGSAGLGPTRAAAHAADSQGL